MKRLLYTITLIIAIGLVAFYFFEKSGGVQDIEFVKLEKLKFNKISPFPKLTLNVTATSVLKNPNPFGVEITGMDFDVLVESKHTTTVNQDVSIEMPANSEFKLPLNFEIPLGKTGFFNDAKDILTGAWKNKSINIRTKGIIHIKVLKINLEIPFDEEEPYKLKDYLPN